MTKINYIGWGHNFLLEFFMPLTITSDFIYSNKAIRIDAPNGVDFIEPNNPVNVHHFNQGDVIPGNTRIDFNNNGQYQMIPFPYMPLGGQVVNMNNNNNNIGILTILNPTEINHNNGDLFAFSPNSQLNGFPGINFGIIFDGLGHMHIDEVAPVLMIMGGIGQP